MLLSDRGVKVSAGNRFIRISNVALPPNDQSQI
jgi:hypothetical protein